MTIKNVYNIVQCPLKAKFIFGWKTNVLFIPHPQTQGKEKIDFIPSGKMNFHVIVLI